MTSSAMKEREPSEADIEQAIADIGKRFAPTEDGYGEACVRAGINMILARFGTRPAAEPVSDIVKLQIEVDEAIQSSSAGEALPGAPIDYGAVMKHRLMHKVNDDWIPASEFLFGLPDKTWVQKTHELPDEWRIDYERRWTGRQIADGIARALNPALSRQAPAAPAEATLAYAQNLARSLFESAYSKDAHYASGDVVWECGNDLVTVLTQIDNMVSGMVRFAPTPANLTSAEHQVLRDAIRDSAEVVAEPVQQDTRVPIDPVGRFAIHGEAMQAAPTKCNLCGMRYGWHEYQCPNSETAQQAAPSGEDNHG